MVLLSFKGDGASATQGFRPKELFADFHLKAQTVMSGLASFSCAAEGNIYASQLTFSRKNTCARTGEFAFSRAHRRCEGQRKEYSTIQRSVATELLAQQVQKNVMEHLNLKTTQAMHESTHAGTCPKACAHSEVY